ncbi:baseplate J/gp47 family protein [Rhodopila sp.]|uniref:baseplate J/gp47 family protein n=1 Tax=Rhodopila sp. TaxID=2480087 RepID=UPI003D115B6C
MPYSYPTLTDLRQQMLQGINAARVTDANGNILVGLLQRSVLRVLANAQAGLATEHYGYIDWISKQAVPFTATGEFLEGWANLKGVTRKPATPTTGTAAFVANATTTVVSGTGIVRSDGVTYTSTADASTVSGSITVPFVAAIPGSAGNFETGAVFNLATSVANVQSVSTTSTQTADGADQETDDELRTRMLIVYAAPPQGGDRQDYIEWALAVPGVTRAWIVPNGMGAGTVTVFVMLDDAEAEHGGFPQGSNGCASNEPRAATATGDQLTVANALFPLQPVTALVYVVAPTPQPTDFTIADLGSNNTAAMQALIASALADMFLRLGQAGGTINPTTGAPWAGIEPSDWYAALEAIPGLSEFKVTVPSGAISPSAGALLTVGTLTFSA